MHRVIVLAALVAAAGGTALAQGNEPGGLPNAVTAEIARLYNDAATDRRSGTVRIERETVIPGSLAVRSGPVSVAGTIRGSLVVINAELTLLPGATIDGDILLVGGRITGRSDASVRGDVQVYAETLRYRLDGEMLVVEDEPSRRARSDDDAFWTRGTAGERTRFNMFALASTSTYNRVEGLPILVGPRLRLRRDWGSVTVEARGIVRTAEPIRWDRGTLGHEARAEFRLGDRRGFGFGLEHVDRIDPVESWQLSDNEVGLATFGLHQDYRDYYGRHGGRGFVALHLARDAWLQVAYGEERWASRAGRDPWTLFRGDREWRPNPAGDEGRARLATSTLRIDTRNQEYSPGAGWFIQADFERGELRPTPPDPESLALSVPTSTRAYSRGFVDVRRYNRIAPGAQVNLRLVFGGWLDGDALPLQRRLSVGGPGTLPGFDFRRHWRGGVDALQCSEFTSQRASGLPAMCDRVALAQIEYRGDLSFDIGGSRDRSWWPDELHTPTWAVFADVGRGWRAKPDPFTTYPIESFPSLSTFKSDLGIGLDFGSLSVSVAKSVSDSKEPANIVVRLNRRF